MVADYFYHIERLRGAFEIFVRSQSIEYFNKVIWLFNIKDKNKLASLIQAFKDQKLKIPTDGFRAFLSPSLLLGYDKIATRP